MSEEIANSELTNPDAFLNNNPPFPPLTGRPTGISNSPLVKGGQGGFVKPEYFDKPDYIPYSKRLKPFSRANRKSMTQAEKKIWYEVLRDKKLGYRFVRQKPIGKYILDFYSSKLQLCIEIDGSTHIGKEIEDRVRDEFLRTLGITTLRFWNSEIKNDLENIKERIISYISKKF
ncbi:MAG: DUF559 domain-containing protein [Candidatus Dojkabacteria bacterium]